MAPSSPMVRPALAKLTRFMARSHTGSVHLLATVSAGASAESRHRRPRLNLHCSRNLSSRVL